MDSTTIKKAIIRSQHCQRNWDLSKSIPQEHMDMLFTAATQCPSKQNIAFYSVHFITNREVIEAIHAHTDGFTVTYAPKQTTTNTQTLANLLVVFEEYNFHQDLLLDQYPRNDQALEFITTGELCDETKELYRRDRDMAVGIAAGYLNLTANLLGYNTGCCACFDNKAIKPILGLTGKVILLIISSINFAVALPGLIPGIKPPLRFMSSAN